MVTSTSSRPRLSKLGWAFVVLFILQLIGFTFLFVAQQDSARSRALIHSFTCDRICAEASELAQQGQPSDRQRQACYSCIGAGGDDNGLTSVLVWGGIVSVLCIGGIIYGRRQATAR